MSAAVTWIALAGWIGVIGAHLITVIVAWLQPRLVRAAPAPADAPRVTVVMPMYDVEPELADNLDKLFAQDYPNFEIALSFSHADDAAIPCAQAAQARWPQVKSSIRIGEAAEFLDPKVRNEFKCLAAATTPFIYVVDSNVALPPDALRRAMRLMRDDVGCLSSCPVAVRPENAFATLEAALINGFAARYLLAGSALGFNVSMGKSMLLRWNDRFKAEVTRQFGKIDAEDAAILFAFKHLGLRSTFSDVLVEHPVGRRGLRELWTRHTRWAMYRRKYHTLTYVLEVISSFFPGLLFAALASPAVGVGAPLVMVGTALLWFAAEAFLHALKGWPLGWTSPLYWLARECLLPAVWFKGVFARAVVWKGRRIPVR
ncbi:MAG: glycosyltransferase [Variibacter sp.]|nr:glycosyltransferase [Variibacter sp.]